VSLGLIRLQQIPHMLGYTYQSGPRSAGVVRRMMIGSAPGSQHLLGLSGQLPLLPELIAQLEVASRNVAIPVILGGPAFLAGDAQGPDFGVVGVSTDAADAVMLGNLLVAAPSSGS
jgi:hypothetical protein